MGEITCPHCGGKDIFLLLRNRAYCRSLTRDNGKKRCFWHFSINNPFFKVWENVEKRNCKTHECDGIAIHGCYCATCRNIKRRNAYHLRKK